MENGTMSRQALEARIARLERIETHAMELMSLSATRRYMDLWERRALAAAEHRLTLMDRLDAMPAAA